MLQLKTLVHQVTSLNAKLEDKIPDKAIPLNIDLTHFYKVRVRPGASKGLIELDTIVAPTPASLFRVEISHSIEFEGEGALNVFEVKQAAFDICNPCGEQISHLVSILTYELIGTHIILPPSLNEDGFVEVKS